MKPVPQLRGYSQDPNIVAEYRTSGRLLSLRLETNYECNLKCRYCYAPEILKTSKPRLTLPEIIDIVDEAKALGIRSVVFVGPGEPTLYDRFGEIIEYLHEQEIVPVIFTNTTMITERVARFLYEMGCSVIGKYDGSKEVQDWLCGEGTFEKIQRGLHCLTSVGFGRYSENALRLGLGTVVCSQNYSEIPSLWRFMRLSNIFPNFERVTVIGRANREMGLSEEEAKDITRTLRTIDEEEFKYKWNSPYTPIPGYSCYLFYVGCHITIYGGVSPCPELPPVADLSNASLKQVLESEEFKLVRSIDKNLRGKCNNCIYLKYCYGCRSKAFYEKGTLFEEDSYCCVTPEAHDKAPELVTYLQCRTPLIND